jgi:hypothetical protein
MPTQTLKLSARRELTQRLAVLTTAAAVGLGTLTATAGTAHADSSAPVPGTVGGAFLGAEVVTIGLSAFGVRNGWAYLIGAVLGAGGGAAAGYAVEQSATDGKAGSYMLAGGIVLTVPAIVLSLNATRYRPAATSSEDRAPTNQTAPDPGRTGNTAAAPQPPTAPPPAAPPPGSEAAPTGPRSSVEPADVAPPTSLVDVHTGTFRVGVPVPEIRPVYTMQQLKEAGVQQATEYRLPVVKVVF